MLYKTIHIGNAGWYPSTYGADFDGDEMTMDIRKQSFKFDGRSLFQKGFFTCGHFAKRRNSLWLAFLDKSHSFKSFCRRLNTNDGRKVPLTLMKSRDNCFLSWKVKRPNYKQLL